MTCPDCGQEVSGPDEASVKVTLERHFVKSGHGPKKEKRNAAKAI